MVDFPPWLQTTLTVVGLTSLVALLAMPHVGVALLRRDRSSVWGLRLVSWGVAGRSALEKAADILSPRARRILQSFPEAEVPSGVDATVRVEKGATLVVVADPSSVAIRKNTPPRPPPLPLLPLLLVLAGCTSTEQVQAANAQRATGHATARTLDELCDYEAADSMRADDARVYTFQLDQRGCDVAWEAQTAFARAHAAQVAAIEAAERGECMIGTPRERPACDLLGVAAKTYTAGRALADSVAAVRAAVAAAGAR